MNASRNHTFNSDIRTGHLLHKSRIETLTANDLKRISTRDETDNLEARYDLSWIYEHGEGADKDRGVN